MDAQEVPVALRTRLGAEATGGLVELFDETRNEWMAEVTSLAVERFERRLTEEVSTLRVEMARGFGDLRREAAESHALLRKDVTDAHAALRHEMTDTTASLRKDMNDMSGSLRREITDGNATLRNELMDARVALREQIAQDNATSRAELLKWSFLFWIGQVVAMTAILGVLLRR